VSLEYKEREEEDEEVKGGKDGNEEEELLRDVTGAGTGELVGIDEEASVGITRVHAEHAVVDILLCALALVAGGKEAAGRVRVEASLKAGGLGVVVVAIAVALRDVLQDDPPVALNVDSPGDLGVVHSTGAEVALGAYPVAGVIGRGALGGSCVVLVVEALLLLLDNVLHQVIG